MLENDCVKTISKDFRTSECALYLQQPRAWRYLLCVSPYLAREWFTVRQGNDCVTINVPMLRIYQDPIKSATCYGPRQVAAWQHLPTGDYLARR